MSLKLQKSALVTIVILLCIFVSLSAGGIYFRFFAPERNDYGKENPNHEFYFDNKLWFYEDGVLLGTYNCETSNCGYAINYTNDTNYSIDSYQTTEITEIPLFNKGYAFLRDFETQDSHEAFLHDIKKGVSYKSARYASVKNYGIGITDNIYILENDQKKFGIMQIGDVLRPILPFEYDFIGLIETMDDNNLLLADYFIVLKEDIWNIVDQNGAKLTEDITENIVTFNGEYIITEMNSSYHIINYDNIKILQDDFVNLSFTGKYLNCHLGYEFYVYDLANNIAISSAHGVSDSDVIETKINDQNNLEVIINEQIAETIPLS